MHSQKGSTKEALSHTVYLAQTDTTVGFISQDADRLTAIKKRPPHKPYIKAINTLDTLKRFSRIPSVHKNRLRRASRSTFILPSGHSYRVIRDEAHLKLISQLQWAYSTSANHSGKRYDETWARAVADEVIEPLNGESRPSAIYKINNKTIKKIR